MAGTAWPSPAVKGFGHDLVQRVEEAPDQAPANSAVIRLRVAAVSHPGVVRDGNEDAVLVGGWISAGGPACGTPSVLTLTGSGPLTVAVADGMGGHAAGEVASRMVLTTLGMHADRLTMEGTSVVIEEANVALHAHGLAHRQDAGAGSTLVGLTFADDSVCVFNVGDSRAYRVLDGYVGQLSLDDRPPRMPGQPGDVVTSTLTQCLGGSRGDLTTVSPHVVAEPARAGDRFLICSDGLHDVVPSEVIGSLATAPLLAAADRLLEEAIGRGAPDNVSFVLVEVMGDPLPRHGT